MIVPFEFPGSLSGRQEEKDLLVLFSKEKREKTDHNTRLPVARSVHALAPLTMRRVCHVTRSETAARAGRKRDGLDGGISLQVGNADGTDLGLEKWSA